MKIELKISTKVGEAIVSEEFNDIALESEWEKYNKMVYMTNTIIGTFGQPSWADNKGVSNTSKSAKKVPESTTEKEPEVKKTTNELATEKQKLFIKKFLNINLASDVTKECAAEMIRDFKKENGWA